MGHALTYAVVTPARDEAESLPVLADSLRTQTLLPTLWVIVENGSLDATRPVAEALAAETRWIDVVSTGDTGAPVRGAPIVRALEVGLSYMPPSVDVIVSVDADVSMSPEYFEQLLSAFDKDPGLGIASGSAYEQRPDGTWQQRFVTGDTVWGATRAYRRSCLDAILPLEHRHGWDGLDQLKAQALGWRTRALVDLPFKHHRPEGARDASNWAHWRACGESSHFMGYRPWYLVTRAIYQARKDRAALGMIWGFASAAIFRRPTWSDEAGRAVLRDYQRFGNLARRRREATGTLPRPRGGA